MTRLSQAWRALEPEQRLAALVALGLFASMFLPWYSKTYTVVVHGAAKSTATSLSATETSLSAFQAFSFVEAAVLLVSAGVLTMLFARGEGRLFQLPGGDGLIVMVAGGWTALLVFYRLLDKPALQGNERITATVGVEWGIFIALLLALGLVSAGGRMRARERPEPPLRRRRGAPEAAESSATTGLHPPAAAAEWRSPADPDLAVTVQEPGRPRRPVPARDPAPARDSPAARDPAPARDRAPTGKRGARPPYPPAPEQLSFEDPPTRSE